MGTTPILKIPYPEATDPVADYPVTAHAAAVRIDEIGAPGAAVANALTPLAGWTIASQSARVAGKLVIVNATVTRTGAAIAGDVDGNVGQTPAFHINPAALGNGATTFVLAGPLGSGYTGRVAVWSMTNLAGDVSLVAVGGPSTVAVNQQLSFAGILWTN